VARSPAAKSSLQFLLGAPIYARSRRLCHIFEQASARQEGCQQDGAMRRYSLVLSLSFCFPFEYVSDLSPSVGGVIIVDIFDPPLSA
jgi:hypothetical protein